MVSLEILGSKISFYRNIFLSFYCNVVSRVNKALHFIILIYLLNQPLFKQPWFHATWSRQQAEDMLSRVNLDGAFLVRVGERVPNSFAITFIAEKKIKHCLVKQVPISLISLITSKSRQYFNVISGSVDT